MSIIYKARKLAEEHHEGLTDKYGNPAIEHIERVVKIVFFIPHGERRSYAAETVAAAYLHDIVEDTSVTLDDVSSMFGEAIGGAVALLTRYGVYNSETYADYISRLKSSPIAVTVKRADLKDHLEGPTPCPTSLVKRYEKALTALAEE